VSGSGLLLEGVGALALAGLALVVALWPKRDAQPGIGRGIAAIEKRYARGSQTGTGKADPFQLPDWLPALAMRLSPAGVASTMQRRLDVAGNPKGWTPDRMLAVKGLLLVVLGVIGALLGIHDPELLVAGAVVGAVVGFFLPDLMLFNAGQKRQQRIPNALPDALDLLTICVEAGLGFDASLAQVARFTDGPLAAEFSRVLQEMQIGKSRTDALRAMAERTTVPELRAFVSALIQSTEMGIPVAHVLREQAKEMRVRRRQRAEAQAQKVPVKITFPLIGCLFPALLVIVLGSGVIEIYHTLFHIIR
jgi:tight adherence protein C